MISVKGGIMKNAIIIICLFLTVSAKAEAPGNRSSLEIISEANMITVAIDRQYFSQPTHFFSVDNIKPGNRYVEIFGIQRYHGRDSEIRLFAGRLHIRQGSRVVASFDPARGFVVRESAPYPYAGYGAYGTYGYNDYSSYAALPVAMGSAQFSQYIRTVNDQWTESNRLQVALQGLQLNFLTTQQVKAVMEVFWTEGARLDFAKAAYLRVVDPQVYYEVNEVFWHPSSVQELSAYILSHR